MSNQLPHPREDQIEVSLFGPGYGEAIALHFGNRQWLLVDSCKEMYSGRPASLNYLEGLGVDTSQHVKMVVITHWHDDHVGGIGEIVRACSSANVVISDALRTDELEELMGYFRYHSVSGKSGVEELREILEVLQERKAKGVRFPTPERAKANQILLQEDLVIDGVTTPVEVWALSPSSSEVTHASLAFTNLIPALGKPEKRIATPKSNYTSVAMWCQIGNHVLLFGADVEARTDPTTGWTNILNNSLAIKRASSSTSDRLCTVFKVSHHGAKSGHDGRIWTDILTQDSLAIVTPWNNANRFLPSGDDLARISRLTPHAYITAPPKTKKTSYRSSAVRDLLNDLTEEIHNVEPGSGQIRLRHELNVPVGDWDITLFGSALRLSKISI